MVDDEVQNALKVLEAALKQGRLDFVALRRQVMEQAAASERRHLAVVGLKEQVTRLTGRIAELEAALGQKQLAAVGLGEQVPTQVAESEEAVRRQREQNTISPSVETPTAESLLDQAVAADGGDARSAPNVALPALAAEVTEEAQKDRAAEEVVPPLVASDDREPPQKSARRQRQESSEPTRRSVRNENSRQKRSKRAAEQTPPAAPPPTKTPRQSKKPKTTPRQSNTSRRQSKKSHAPAATLPPPPPPPTPPPPPLVPTHWLLEDMPMMPGFPIDQRPGPPDWYWTTPFPRRARNVQLPAVPSGDPPLPDADFAQTPFAVDAEHLPPLVASATPPKREDEVLDQVSSERQQH